MKKQIKETKPKKIYKLVVRMRSGYPYHCWYPTTKTKSGELVKFDDIMMINSNDGRYITVGVCKKDISIDDIKSGLLYSHMIKSISFGELMDEIHNRMMIHLRDKKITNILCK